MNRLWVRLLFAMLAVGFVAGVGQWFVMGYLIYAFSNNLSDPNAKTISAILQKTVEKFTLSDNEGWILVAIAFASVIVALFSAILISSWIARPLWAVSKAAEQVAEGEWSARASIASRAMRGNSETARLVRNFNTMADSLERLEVERTASVAAIAHELRTPLTVLRGRLEAIRDGVLELDSTESNLLVQQVELLSRLVGDLRTLSLAEAGKLSLQLQVTDLASLTRSIVTSFEARAGEKSVRLEIVTPDQLEVKLDPNRYHQVLGNLLENALRHTPEDGFVRVSLEVRELSAELLVRDSGTGIPEDALEQIFERFYRVESSRNRASGGSGLGLAIVRAVVEAHGGIILARNAQGGGAEFRVSLPLEGAERLPLRTRPSLRQKSSTARPKKNDLEDQTLSSITYLLLGLPFGILYFVVLIVGFSLGLPLAIFWLGLPVLYATFVVASSFARFERWLLESLLGRAVLYRIEVPSTKASWLGRFGRHLALLITWKELIYLILKFPFGLVSSIITIVLLCLDLGLLLSPLLLLTKLDLPVLELGRYTLKMNSLENAAISLAIGVVLTFVSLPFLNWLARINGAFAQLMLSNASQEPKTEPTLEIRSKTPQL
jgi:two-component system, OmpR family, sensor histidine kinase BaeS